ncbi:MAG: response regulator transcription factor [Clostridia bacterium]|nr:response regulator transcription factor [Clostridia bacterium]
MMRIFIVEDDDAIAQAIINALESWEYEIRRGENYRDILPEFESFNPHLVLMDVLLPCFNGYHWCQKIRETSNVPVVFITSQSDNMNLIMAMNMGGDDFIAKPFDMDVLLAKIRAILRRAYDFIAGTSSISHGGAVLNMADATIRAGAEQIDLSKNEYRIMQVLMENAGSTVSREALMERLWQTDSYIDENALAVNMTRLRKKLAAAGLDELIKTRRGIGYIIDK